MEMIISQNYPYTLPFLHPRVSRRHRKTPHLLNPLIPALIMMVIKKVIIRSKVVLKPRLP